MMPGVLVPQQEVPVGRIVDASREIIMLGDGEVLSLDQLPVGQGARIVETPTVGTSPRGL